MLKKAKKAFLTGLQKENDFFLHKLKNKKIKEVNFIILGNSLASGYTVVNKIRLFFDRNEDLLEKLKEAKIVTHKYHFAQPYDNENSKILSWLKNNQTSVEVFAGQKRNYFMGARKEIDKWNIDEKTLESFFAENMKENLGVKDLIKKNEVGKLNLVIFLGNTGETMARVKDENIFHYIKASAIGLKKDLINFQRIITYLANLNEKTLVLIMGIPRHQTFIFRIFNLLIRGFNYWCKKVAEKEKNILFIDGEKMVVKRYKVNGENLLDLHPDDESYLYMLTQCMRGLNKILDKKVEN